MRRDIASVAFVLTRVAGKGTMRSMVEGSAGAQEGANGGILSPRFAPPGKLGNRTKPLEGSVTYMTFPVS